MKGIRLIEIHEELESLARDLATGADDAFLFAILADRIEATGKALEDLTVGELAAIVRGVREEFAPAIARIREAACGRAA